VVFIGTLLCFGGQALLRSTSVDKHGLFLFTLIVWMFNGFSFKKDPGDGRKQINLLSILRTSLSEGKKNQWFTPID